MQSSGTTSASTGDESLGPMCDQMNVTKTLDCGNVPSPHSDKFRVPAASSEKSVDGPQNDENNRVIDKNPLEITPRSCGSKPAKSDAKGETNPLATDNKETPPTYIRDESINKSACADTQKTDPAHCPAGSAMKEPEDELELPSEDDFLSDVEYDE